MLWYKGWLETRRIALVMLALSFTILLFILLFTLVQPAAHSPFHSLAQAEAFVGLLAMYYSVGALFLAGSGIKTQSAQIRKGLHGSMYFTLSLPVSRFRLFATRVGLGMLETAVILAFPPCLLRIVFVEPADHVSPSDLFAFWVTLSVCASAVYFLGVLLSTLLDDDVQGWVRTFGFSFYWLLLSAVPLTASGNIFRAMVSPLSTHSLPWASMGISLGVAAVLGLAAFRVVQTREY